MPVSIAALADQLLAEHAALDGRVAALAAADWDLPTPAAGWTVRDQISHLAYFDATAATALTDPTAFDLHLRTATAALAAAAGSEPLDVALGRAMAPGELLATWRANRGAFLDALAAADAGARVPWYGPAMAPSSFVTARLMETWAHGTDVGDALGLAPVESERLRNIVHLGFRARAYAFMAHGIEDPGTPVGVIAHLPDGAPWTWLPEATERIEGPALDLALVFTQRRHPGDTSVSAEGPVAERWLSIAQAFAGPAGPGRPRAGTGAGR